MKVSNSYLNNMTIQNWFSWLNPQRDLEARIHAISKQKYFWTFSLQQRDDLKQGLKLSHSWSWGSGRIKALLLTFPKEAIKTLMLDLIASDESNIDHYLQLCCNLQNTKALLDLTQFKTIKIAETSFNMHCLTKSSALKNTYLKREGLSSWQGFVIELKYFINQFINVLITLTGLNEITRKKVRYNGENGLESYEAKNKFEMYLQIVGYPITLFGLIYSYIEFQTPAIILTIAIIVSVIASVLFYNRYLKPCPIDHAGLKNLTIDLLRESDPIYPRKEILKKIELAFQRKKGVILVGEPGAGKSWVARSFVQQISQKKICAFIKNPQVFSCNASSFSNHGFSENSFASMEENFIRHKDQVVFFFDEFHSLFKENKTHGNAPAEQIKTFCEDFKYVIGATTTAEYNRYIKNQPAIDERRFEIIHVNPMDFSQIKISLSELLESKSLNFNFDADVFDYIINNAKRFNPKTSTVDAAHSLLNNAIQKLVSITPHELKDHLVRLKEELDLIEQSMIHGAIQIDSKKMEEQIIKLHAKKAEIVQAKASLNQTKLRIEKIQNREAYLLELKNQSYKLAKESMNLAKNPMLAREWYQLHACIKTVKEFVIKERKSLGLPYSLNNELVEKIIEERTK